jgi:sugar O-acyltransferase (sialic acid O-acetyltransferase NeuD family)
VSVLIVGASGHGREVLDVVLACGHDVVGFADDGRPDRGPLDRLGVALLGGIEVVASHDGPVVLGIGDSAVRRRVAAQLGAARWATAMVHPAASLGRDVELAEGTVVAAGARLTTHISAGPHCYVGPNATVGHDTVLGACVTILPGATVSGSVTLGDGAVVGTGANLRQGVRIGDGAMVGAGAVVLADVAPGATVVGVPARPR